MKILAVASAIDLDFRYGCTPAWWQLWRALNDEGAELTVAPYRGRPIETPYWRSAPNPTYLEGDEAVFIRFMDRGNVDDLVRALDLLQWSALNEFKRPRIPR